MHSGVWYFMKLRPYGNGNTYSSMCMISDVNPENSGDLPYTLLNFFTTRGYSKILFIMARPAIQGQCHPPPPLCLFN